jgi:hypothetical protein
MDNNGIMFLNCQKIVRESKQLIPPCVICCFVILVTFDFHMLHWTFCVGGVINWDSIWICRHYGNFCGLFLPLLLWKCHPALQALKNCQWRTSRPELGMCCLNYSHMLVLLSVVCISCCCFFYRIILTLIFR